MVEPGTSEADDGIQVDAVDWLPSGARSGLIRVRGRWTGPHREDLPDLVVDHDGREHRHTSLPDPRASADPAAWRGAYVVAVDLVHAASGKLVLEWPGGPRVALPAPDLDDAPPPPPAVAEPEPPGGEVVDRAVLAERRARRAEAAEQAQARIAREALRAVEVLELRMGELEQRIAAATAERDELRARLDEASPGEPDEEAERREDELRAELEDLRAALAEQPPPAPPPPPPVVDTASERRAERLKAALAATIVTVGELRIQLHEAQLARRTRDVAHGADAVRLTVVEGERTTLAEALAAARLELREAQGARDDAANQAAAEVLAHEQTRTTVAERTEELRVARDRIGELERDLAEARAEAQRARDEIAPAVEAALAERSAVLEAEIAEREREGADRLAAAEAAFAEREETVRDRLAEWERAEAALLARVEAAEGALVAAETAREMAEATAVAATAERRALEVAHAQLVEQTQRGGDRDELAAELATLRARSDEMAAEVASLRARESALREELEAARRAPEPPPEPEPEAAPVPEVAPVPEPTAEDPRERVRRLAAEIVASAAERAPEGDRERVVENLAAAAAALRTRATPVEAEEPRRPTVVMPPETPPQRVVRARDYPPLRGALVKLAHDDPRAAAEIVVGLLPAQWRLLDRPVDYELHIEELGSFTVSVTAGGVSVSSGDDRPSAPARLRVDALTLTEMLAGVGPKPSLFGRARASGRRFRDLRVLQVLAAGGMSLEQALRAGATVDPVHALRCLSYAVHPSWTAGHDFTIAETITGPEGDRTVYLTARDGRGLACSTEPPATPPAAEVTLSRAAFDAMLRGEAPPPGERPAGRGNHRAVEQLRAWAERVRSGV